MTVAVFPGTLPQYLQTSNYQETLKNYDVIETSMDTGPSKRRARSKAAPTPLSGTLLMDKTQIATFKTFYYDTLNGGCDIFEWYDPLTRTPVYMRFNPPVITSNNGGGTEFNISMDLEILP